MSPRTILIDGAPTTVVERQPPLPAKLDQLIARLFSVTVSTDITPSGATNACDLRMHRFATLREGRYLGPDRLLRDLRIEMCPHCGACCVRDISYDRVSGLPIGRGGLRRRDLVLGWYSGARRNQRVYSS